MADHPAVEPQAIVIFGASGDLTERKLLPAFYHLFVERLVPPDFAIVGYARTRFTDETFRQHARDAIIKHGRRHPSGQDQQTFADSARNA